MQMFEDTGVHTVVDGQFGSTGKGVLSAFLAKHALDRGQRMAAVISNAGPNSGHTFYYGDQKVVLKQLPVFAMATAMLSYSEVKPPIYLSAGAIIDVAVLAKEARMYPGPIFVHPNAAVITDEDREAEHSGTIAAVAGTRSGTGAALARKVQRDPDAVMGNYGRRNWLPENVRVASMKLDWMTNPYFMEVSQGFSLGINQQFYPKCTSRECTVSQAYADAGIPPQAKAQTYMSMRTYPIRVGNVDGHSSGDWYPDQEETSWEKLGVTPELTTVTQRVRRVATFSGEQFMDALWANAPGFVFVNFMNYLPGDRRGEFLGRIRDARDDAPLWFDLLACYGPKSEDVQWVA